jgi:hypothetical protein
MPDDTTPPSTEAQRRTERLGNVALCRCAMTHDESGHWHECIAARAHGWHRCYCGQWFQPGHARDPLPASAGELGAKESGTPGSMREARLRSEFAALYRWMQPDVWYLAVSLQQPSDGEARRTDNANGSPRPTSSSGAARAGPASHAFRVPTGARGLPTHSS